jgi:hypothetical protein
MSAPRVRFPRRHDRARNCGTCDFWQPSGEPWRTGRDEPGTCHRYAPTMPAGFPATANTDWCGEYEADPAAMDLAELAAERETT